MHIDNENILSQLVAHYTVKIRVISWAIDETEDFEVICTLPWAFMLILESLIEFCSKIYIKDAQWEGA